MAGRAPPARRPAWRDLARTLAVAGLVAVVLRGSMVEPCAVTGGGMAPTLLPGDVLVVSRLAYGLKMPFSEVTLWPLTPPGRGDVVVFRDPTTPSRRLVKRVVGLPGDTVELREQVLYVDGVAQGRLERGDFSYLEPGGAEEPAHLDTCRRLTELLDLGQVRPRPEGPDPAAEGWARLGSGQATRHDLLQCRRPRAGRREGPYGPVRPGHLFVLGDNRDRSADGRSGWEVPLSEVVGRGALVGFSWGPGGWWPWGGAGVRIDRLFKPVE